MTDVVPDKVIQAMKTLIPQGRLGKPEGNYTSGLGLDGDLGENVPLNFFSSSYYELREKFQ